VLLLHGGLQRAGEPRCASLAVARGVGLINRLQHRADALAVRAEIVLSSAKTRNASCVESSRLTSSRAILRQTVPLVTRWSARGRFEDVTGDVRILFRNIRLCVDQENDDVGVLDRLQRLDDGEFLDDIVTLPRLAHSAVSMSV